MNCQEIKDRLQYNIGTNGFIVAFISLILSIMLLILLWRLFKINLVICLIVVIIIFYIMILKFIYNLKFYENYFIIDYPVKINFFSKKNRIHFYDEIKYINYSWKESFPVTIPEVDIFFYEKKLPIIIICFSIEKIAGLIDFLKSKQSKI